MMEGWMTTGCLMRRLETWTISKEPTSALTIQFFLFFSDLFFSNEQENAKKIRPVPPLSMERTFSKLKVSFLVTHAAGMQLCGEKEAHNRTVVQAP
jgi:hypothetical protein